jgi:predicted CxxxxCH...CXXCH cytochrome family protein
VPDAAALAQAPRWDDGPAATTGCAGCHGGPPASHAQADCTICHPSSTPATGTLGATHLDGAIQVGDGSSTCTSCHGSNGNAAPPRGLHGELSTSDLAVGAHRIHLGPSPLTGVIACAECHLVPASRDAVGHIDTALPAEVFPPGSGTRARADGAVPVWNRATRTCSNVYCHGGGTRLLSTDPTVGVRAPVWTAKQQVYCGSCHGIPPADSYHAPTLTITDCTTCHPDIDPFGNIIVTGSPPSSQHINGTIEFR